MKLTDTKKRAIFKSLASMSQHAAGVEHGLDKHYEGNTAVINAVGKIYRQVKENPEKYAVSPELVEMVEQGMAARRQLGRASTTEIGASASDKSLEKLDTKDLVVSARNKAWVLMHRKLDRLARNPRDLNRESLMSIAKVAGITFDKGQIAQGAATEHIAIHAKVDESMSVEEMLAKLVGAKRASEDDAE